MSAATPPPRERKVAAHPFRSGMMRYYIARYMVSVGLPSNLGRRGRGIRLHPAPVPPLTTDNRTNALGTGVASNPTKRRHQVDYGLDRKTEQEREKNLQRPLTSGAALDAVQEEPGHP
jgi:hypothetical protein